MSQENRDVYVVAAVRTPVGKARGLFKNTRPDDLLAAVWALPPFLKRYNSQMVYFQR